MTDKDDQVPLTWSAEPGEEIEVLTEEFCDHFGGCALPGYLLDQGAWHRT